jgi:hypothetical protein
MNDVAAAARLRARVEIADAEIRTLEALPLEPRARTIIAISKTDLQCATTRLDSRPDTPELDYLGQWLEMVESQLRAVRRSAIPATAAEPTRKRSA